MPEVVNNPLSKLVNYLEAQKQQNRAIEDAEIDRKITLIHDLINAPGANPARTAEGISNLMELYAAKGGRGTKPAKGQGPWGKSETPMPSLLAGIIHGSIPFEGPTTEAVPQPQSPAQQGLMPEAPAILPGLTREMGTPPDPSNQARAEGFTGKDALNSPVMVPPAPLQAAPEASRMLSAARDMQKYNEGPKTRPVANQPMMRDPMEIAQEQAQIKAMGDTTMMQAEMDQAIKMGADPALARQMVMEKHGLKQTQLTKPVAGSNKPYIYTGPDGKPVIVNGTTYLKSDGTSETRNAVTGMPLPPDAQEYFHPTGSQASPYTTHWEQDKNGVWHVSYAAKDPNAGFDPKTLSTGMVGHLPPAPTFTYDTPDPNHPGLTIPVVAPKVVTPGVGAPGTSLPPKAQKLGTEEQTFVDTAQGIQGTMDRVTKSIEEAGLQHANSITDWGSTQAQNWIRKQGFEPEQFQADLQQQTGYIRATLLRSLLGGRPNKYVTEIFQSHLPAEFQTPAQIYNTMRLVRQEIQDRYAGISQGHGGQALPSLGGQSVPPPPQAKLVTVDQLHQYATEHKITDDKARELFISKGYAVVKPNTKK